MLEIKNIVKQYAKHRALDDVSMHVQKGKIFGLLGPNGAGKTSLIRIINQITAPDSGEVIFDGEKLNSEHIGRIGYLPEERGLYKKMEIGEQMLYLAQLKGLKRADAIQKIKYWFQKMEMETWWNKKIEELSKGMQQKVQFVATVIHQPDLIILDEPFSGFDPVNANIIKEEILSLNRNGSTIIFSTHRMESVEELCDDIALINRSKKILEGSVKDVKNQYKTNTFKIALKNFETNPSFLNSSFNILDSHIEDEILNLTIKLEEEKTINTSLMEFMKYGDIVELKEIIPSIHDIFIEQVTNTADSNS